MKKVIFAAFTALLVLLAFYFTDNKNETPTDSIPYVCDTICDTPPQVPCIEDTIYALAYAFAMQESELNEHAISRCGKYVGCMQISRIMVAEANRICTVELFFADTNVFCDDRLDRQGSLAIFRTVMDYHNPKYDIDKAVNIWNHHAPHSYRNNVKKYFRQALKDDSLRAYFD
jgi:hypothetical protein